MITDRAEQTYTPIPPKVMVYGSPSRYIQGPGVFDSLSEYTAMFGKRVYAIIDVFFYEDMSRRLKEMYAQSGGEVLAKKFAGEVTETEIEACCAEARAFGAEVVVGIGGGKTLDTTKNVGITLDIPLINMPTTASTDASTSGHAVVYTETGEVKRTNFFNRNPDMVLVDSEIIMRAPVRFLVSGMGDALATYFEARANAEAGTNNYIYMQKGGGKRTRTGMAIAETSYRLLIAEGLQAKIAAENGALTQALEDIIEVNTLMSGVGFENTGCAGAHSIQQGISFLPDKKDMLHGEEVAFGVICQLIVENRPMAELDEVLNFCLDIGLPVTLADLHIENTQENIRIIADSSMHSMWNEEPVYVDADIVRSAITAADALGRRYKQARGL